MRPTLRRRFRPLVDVLEDRLTPAPYTLTTGVGDGSVTVQVDGFGSFGTAVGSNSDDAIYDPIGAIAAAGTSFESGVAIRFGAAGPRSFLSSGFIGSSGGLTNPLVTGTSTSGTSTFVNGGLNFSLVQTVGPSFVAGVRSGSILTQTYTITNPGASTVNFELVRYLDGYLDFDGSLIDGGGRLAGPPETLFETDSGATGSTNTTFVGTTAVGGLTLGSNRYSFDYWSTVRSEVESGAPLDNIIQGDGNADGFVDSPFDPAQAIRCAFTLAPGASTVYVTQTIFGSGTPQSALVGITTSESAGNTAVTEGGAGDDYTIVLNSQPTAPVFVTLNAGTQLNVASPVLTFTTVNWNLPQTVNVSASDDAVFEGPHAGTITHNVTSADAAYQGMALANITATITDNEPATGVTITPSGGSTDVAEGGATDTFTIVLVSQPTANVTITLSGVQVLTTPIALAFTPSNWNVPQVVTVRAIDDAVFEGPHSGVITPSATSADATYNGTAIGPLTANITDNELPPGITLAESGGSTSVAEGGATDTYTLVLDSRPSANVTITLNLGGQLVATPGVVIFTPLSWNLPRTVTLSAIDDGAVEGPHAGTVAHTVTSADAGYGGLVIPGVTATITDNDFAGVIVTPSGSPTVLEGTATSYTIQLTSQPAADVIITPNPDTQVIVSPANVTFNAANWNVPQTITVTSINDSVVEGPLDAVVAHNSLSADSNYNGLSLADFSVLVVDNDGLILQGTASRDNILLYPSTDLSRIMVSINNKITSYPVSVAQIALYAGEGSDSIQITSCPIPVMVNGGLGVDTVFVTGQANIPNVFVLDTVTLSCNSTSVSAWSVESWIVGGRGLDDTFMIDTRPTIPVEFKGDAGIDTVIASDTVNTWAITSNNTGTLNSTIKLTGIESLTGGADVDTFKFAIGKSVSGIVDGGSGSNTLDYSLYATAVTVNLPAGTATATQGFRNIDRIVGGKVLDTLIAPAQTNQWTVSAANSGDLNGQIFFQGFENLIGGGQDDTFALLDGQGIKTRIDGGLGNNTLDYAGFPGTVTVNLEARTASGAGNIANLQNVLAGPGNDRLIAANKSNTWTMAGTDAGTLFDGATTFNFTGFENLTGGTTTDTFQGAGPWSGKIDGGLGTDTLSGSLVPAVIDHVWRITDKNFGTLDGLAFANIENLVGTAGNDSFLFAAGKVITGKIDGGAGANVLDFSAYTTALTVSLQTSSCTGTAGFANVGTFLAGRGNDTFVGANAVNAWHLTGANVGDLNGVVYNGFENLTGGGLSDTFTLDPTGNWSGNLNGMAGTDRLIGPTGRTNTWLLSSPTGGTLNGRRFIGIETRV